MEGDRFDSKTWLRDFESFLEAPEQIPPSRISKSILACVLRDLNPPISLVAIKAITIQGITAFILLLFCPQLGVGPLLGQALIMGFFMHFGPIVCSLFCDALFLGAGTLVLCLFLKKEELRVAYRNRIIGIPLFTALALSGLMLVGGEADRWAYLYWSLGATLGSYLVLSAGTKIRFQFAHVCKTV